MVSVSKTFLLMVLNMFVYYLANQKMDLIDELKKFKIMSIGEEYNYRLFHHQKDFEHFF